MNKPLILRLHRWIAVILSIPLAILIVTGLILSFEPIVAGSAVSRAPISATAIDAVLAKHDPDGKARALFVRAYDGSVSISGARRDATTHVDLASNERIAGPGGLASLFSSSRRLHETLMLQLRWLVTASTAAMLVLIGLGILLGWPRLRNSVSGWHKGTAWVLLPLLILSPLTGLLMSVGVGFGGAPAGGGRQGQSQSMSLRDAVHVIAADRDLAAVSWIRTRGNAVMARLDDGGEMRVFTVGRDGLRAGPRNWPRLIHEGNWRGTLSAAVNIVISVGLLLLLTTGLVLWGRRTFRRKRGGRRETRGQPSLAPASGRAG